MFTLAVYLHDLNPYAIKLWEGGPIRWYGLSYLLGFLLGYFLIRRVTKAGRSTVKPAEVADMVVTLAIGIVVGGRLGYVFFYDPSLRAFRPDFPWWGVLAINRGGMASHGGMIGAVVAALWYALRRKHSWAHVLDLAAFATPIGLFFGRLANFVNGELYGRPVAPGSMAMKWAVQFPQEMIDWVRHDPDKLEQIRIAAQKANLSINPPPGFRLTDDILASNLLRDVQEHNADVTALVTKFLPARHPSQIYEALMEGLALMALLLIVWWKPRKPLVVSAWFCIGYGVVRIIGEQFRLPDSIIINQEYARWGVTRGQLLSSILLAAGLVMLVIAARRKAPAVGGWRGSVKQ